MTTTLQQIESVRRSMAGEQTIEERWQSEVYLSILENRLEEEEKEGRGDKG